MFKKFYSNKQTHLKTFIYLCLLTTIFNLQHVYADDLNSVQRQIKENKQTQLAKQQQQKKLETALAESDQAIAKISLQVSQTKKEISEKRTQLIALQKEKKQLKFEKTKQQSLLEQQLTSAYMTGQNDLIKLILNQEDLSKIVRAKSYYHYLNQARLESIENLQKTEQELAKNEEKQSQTLTSLRKMYEEQKKTEVSLRTEKSKRDKALKTLNQDIHYQSKKIAELTTLEENLKARIKKAAEERAIAIAKEKAQEQERRQKAEQAEIDAVIAAKRSNHAKFSTLKGKLKWPLKGKVINRFGSTRSSQVTWKGIVLSAKEGERVYAVAPGRILYAGYFKGYGMVIAIDHNDNYITLYGHNQTLLQPAGTIVQQGDAIALAGKSGGQEDSTLYFELNHKGKAQNPLNWLSKKAW